MFSYSTNMILLHMHINKSIDIKYLIKNIVFKYFNIINLFINTQLKVK